MDVNKENAFLATSNFSSLDLVLLKHQMPAVDFVREFLDAIYGALVEEPCKDCRGQGQIRFVTPKKFRPLGPEIDSCSCPTCSGSGKVTAKTTT